MWTVGDFARLLCRVVEVTFVCFAVVDPVLAHRVNTANLLTSLLIRRLHSLLYLPVHNTVSILSHLTGVRRRIKAGTILLLLLHPGTSYFLAMVDVCSEGLVVEMTIHSLTGESVECVELTVREQFTVSLT